MAAVTNQPDMIVEDALCLRLGTVLAEAEQSPLNDRPGPHDLAEALVTAAAAAVAAAVDKTAPWRVLTAVAGILPYPNSEAADDAIARLRNTAGGHASPTSPGPVLTGPVLWTRDRYGSRFAVTAPITTAEAPMRWYLWDIDACGHQAFTVDSGFHGTSAAALARWQAGVGPIAAAGTELTAVDDPSLLAQLLPAELGFMRVGGENEAQLAEYHRSRRLAETVQQAMSSPGTDSDDGLDAVAAVAEFTTWLRARDTDRQELPADLDELATELADSWSINDIGPVFATCSPHRVALSVLHMRDFYRDDFADQLLALLPDWTRWLAARNATPPDLADRCLPYANGEPYPQIHADRTGPDYLARVIE